MSTTFIVLLCAGSFVVGILATVLAVIIFNRWEENAAFRQFWMP